MSATPSTTPRPQPVRVEIAAADLRTAASEHLQRGFRWYVMCNGVESAEGLELQHLLRHPETGEEVLLCVKLDPASPRAPSLVQVYDGADWFERETWEMFGIVFDDHPDLRRLLLPEDWDGFPLRKSYPMSTSRPPFRPAPAARSEASNGNAK